MTQQYCLASVAAWLSPTGISHRSLLPHVPSGHLPTVNSRPHPEIAPQPLCSSSPPLCLLGDPCPCLRVLVATAGIVHEILIPFRLPQISCFTHSLSISLLIQTLPRCGDQTAASVPPPAEGRSSPTNSSVFPPNSFVLLSLAWFYIFFSSGWVLLSAVRLICTT